MSAPSKPTPRITKRDRGDHTREVRRLATFDAGFSDKARTEASVLECYSRPARSALKADGPSALHCGIGSMYRSEMFAFLGPETITLLVFLVFPAVCLFALYWVVRLAVRHELSRRAANRTSSPSR